MGTVTALNGVGNPDSTLVVNPITEYREAKPLPNRLRNDRTEKNKRDGDRELRRQAVHIVDMLPNNTAEAHKVLAYAFSFLNDFIDREPAEIGLSVVKRD